MAFSKITITNQNNNNEILNLRNDIESGKSSHNFNIFIVATELPALISILKRFMIYFIFVFLFFTSLFFIKEDLFFGLNFFSPLMITENIIGLNDINLYHSWNDINCFILLKTIIFLHLFLNIFLVSFYYLNSYLLMQKYNSIDKFRGNDLIPNALDFEQDGERHIMWLI